MLAMQYFTKQQHNS